MLKAILSASVVAGVLFATGAQSATIDAGNAVIPRANSDSYQNFSILDGNNPINGSGNLYHWSIYAPVNASAVELLIYRFTGSGYSLVGQSALETPNAAGGIQNFGLAGGLAVQTGDLLGLYFQGTGSAEFDYTPGGFMSYTDNNSGLANATIFAGSSERTYSVSVSSVPETSTWAMMLLGFASLGFAGYRSANKTRATMTAV